MSKTNGCTTRPYRFSNPAISSSAQTWSATPVAIAGVVGYGLLSDLWTRAKL
jgi:hypothetical protein